MSDEISLTSRVLPRAWGSLIPPLIPPLSLSEMTRALRAKVRSSGVGDWRCVIVGWMSMDAQQFQFPYLAPRVERGLPWSLPRPFCLSPGFSFPVDPYRTGEFLLAVSVRRPGSHWRRCYTHYAWIRFLQRRFAHELSVSLHYAHIAVFNRKEIFAMVFFFLYAYGSKKKRDCVRQARARSISQTSTHIFIAAVCARGGAAAGWIEKVSACRETAGVGRGARCSFSDRAAGGVSAGRRGEA